MARVLVVDDDRSLTAALAEGLRCEGYVVEVVYDGEAVMQAVHGGDFDAIVLDIQLPRRNGYQVLRALRSAQVDTPVLMLTAKDGEFDQAEGLDAGADDYLTKPFSYVVLLARLRVLLRRGRQAAPVVLHVGGLQIDVTTRRVQRDGSLIELTNREFEILVTLARNAGRPVSKTALATSIWNDAATVPDNLIEKHVSSLRRKVDGPFGTATLETLRGYGYRMVGR